MTSLAHGRRPQLDEHAGVALGVIDDARRHRRRRHTRLAALALALATLVAGLLWAYAGDGSHAASTAITTPGLASAQREARQAGFDVRLVPTLSVGYVGWCAIPEEHGRADGSACGPLPTPGGPVLQAFGWGESGRSVSIAVTRPDVASVQWGAQRVPTLSLPGLPYGLRAARVLDAPPGGRLVAFDADGEPIHEQPTAIPPRQATVRTWRHPQSPPRGVCEIGAPAGLPGVETLGGSVALTVVPYGGEIDGHAFTTCASAEYRLGGEPLKAFVLVDAEAPSRFAALLPGFHGIEHGERFFADGGLTARRYRGGWIVARQGRDVQQRIALLEHLTAKMP